MGLSLPRSRRVEPYSPTYKDWRIPDTPGPMSPLGSAVGYSLAEDEREKQPWIVKVCATVAIVFAIGLLGLWLRGGPLTRHDSADVPLYRSWSSVDSPWTAGDKVWWNPGFSKPKMPTALWNSNPKGWWRPQPATKTASSMKAVDQTAERVVTATTTADEPKKMIPMFGHGAALLAREMFPADNRSTGSGISIPDFPLSQRRLEEVDNGESNFLDRGKAGTLAWHAMLPSNDGLMRSGGDFTELSFFHQLRCLNQIRDVLTHDTHQVSDRVWTCMEYLRLSMLCGSGEPVLESIAGGGGMTQERRCRDPAAIRKWVEEQQK